MWKRSGRVRHVNHNCGHDLRLKWMRNSWANAKETIAVFGKNINIQTRVLPLLVDWDGASFELGEREAGVYGCGCLWKWASECVCMNLCVSEWIKNVSDWMCEWVYVYACVNGCVYVSEWIDVYVSEWMCEWPSHWTSRDAGERGGREEEEGNQTTQIYAITTMNLLLKNHNRSSKYLVRPQIQREHGANTQKNKTKKKQA